MFCRLVGGMTRSERMLLAGQGLTLVLALVTAALTSRPGDWTPVSLFAVLMLVTAMSAHAAV